MTERAAKCHLRRNHCRKKGFCSDYGSPNVNPNGEGRLLIPSPKWFLSTIAIAGILASLS